MGIGSLGPSLAKSAEYRRGYLCGMIRGDAHVGSYSYPRPGRAVSEVHRFRLALTDLEAVHRSRDYLAAAGVPTREFQFLEGNARHRPMTAIRTSTREAVERVRDLIDWPTSPTIPGRPWRGVSRLLV